MPVNVSSSSSCPGDVIIILQLMLQHLMVLQIIPLKPVFLALIHRYATMKSMQSLSTNQRLTADNFNAEDPQLAKNRLVPFSHMKLSKMANGNPKLELIDTEAISSAVWTQTDYDNPSYTWLLRYWGNRESQCEGFLTTPLLV